MCGRFTMTKLEEELTSRFRVVPEGRLGLKPRYNIAPSQEIPAIINHQGKNKLIMMRWGILAPWSTKEKPINLINLRSETVVNKPNFRKYLDTARCIVPADSFYEWKAQGKIKNPYRFVLNNQLFGLGAVYRKIPDESGNDHYTFCLITTTPNEIVVLAHDRMPVIISQEKEAYWLDPNSKPADYIPSLAPYPGQHMQSYIVSRKLNTASNDTPDLILPVTAGSGT